MHRALHSAPPLFPIKAVLTHHKTVSLSYMALDLPLWSVVEASATLYEKDSERYHLLLPEPALEGYVPAGAGAVAIASPRFLWLEL